MNTESANHEYTLSIEISEDSVGDPYRTESRRGWDLERRNAESTSHIRGDGESNGNKLGILNP